MERTLTKPTVINLAGDLTPERAEVVISLLADAEGGSPVSLDLSRYPAIRPGAGWRIGCALRRFSGSSLEASIPPLTDGDWFRDFSRSGLGYSLAVHAGKIVAGGTDVSSQFRNFYTGIGRRADEEPVLFSDLHRGISVNPEREDLFRDDFVEALRSLRVRPSSFGREGLGDLIKLAFEAIQNVFDHARHKPIAEGAKVASYLSLDRSGSISGLPDPTGLLRGYARRTTGFIGWRMTDFVQVCVTDDGVGMAARQAQDSSVYRGPLVTEVAVVREALTERSSVKSITQDCRIRGSAGHGYSYIHASLQALKAFAILRTGRLLAVFDGSYHSRGFEFLGTELGYMPGTTLEVLVPSRTTQAPSLTRTPKNGDHPRQVRTLQNAT